MQGQDELDQIAFELANKISKGQIKLNEVKHDQINSEEIKAIQSNMIDWERDWEQINNIRGHIIL